MLDRQQLDQFHRDGLLVLRGVFAADELHALQQAAEAVQQDALAGRGAGHSYRQVDGDRQYFRTDGVLWRQHTAFRIATVHPGLLAAVGQCLGHPFMPVNDSLVVKLPRSGVAIPWHQDAPYEGPAGRPATFGIPNFTCDIYLDAATIRNGCLYALPSRHLVGHVDVERFDEQALFHHPDAVALELAPGDVLLHAISAPHGSKANASDELRRVLYLHYMAREVLEALYPAWVGSKRGFAPYDLRAVAAMVDERHQAGLAGPETASVALIPDGLVFTGEPTSPPRHWQALAAALTPDQVHAAKLLAAKGVVRR
ncbi:MAG TPA: phytanoyl-CoA dioxygenase family protein [Actinomycetes bacterium]|jgi:ectoine hydroxylase-related dioxygenase (phytanoyl-CoA dioxygenase family)|nr:phytanoyl-CoA dioxygenase family protein [Actinomycetes bacterium]